MTGLPEQDEPQLVIPHAGGGDRQPAAPQDGGAKRSLAGAGAFDPATGSRRYGG